MVLLWLAIQIIGWVVIYLLYRLKIVGFETFSYAVLGVLWVGVVLMFSETMNILFAVLFSTATAGGMIFWAHVIFEQKRRDGGHK